MGGVQKHPYCRNAKDLLGGGGVVLGHSLGTLRHSVLGELSGEDEAHSGLDFSGGDGVLLVVPGKTTGLRGESLEDIVDEGVHDHHRLLGDTSVGVDLLQHLVDVGGIRGVVGLLAVGLLANSSLLGRLGLGCLMIRISNGAGNIKCKQV